jgi:hypothetical protein
MLKKSRISVMFDRGGRSPEVNYDKMILRYLNKNSIF